MIYIKEYLIAFAVFIIVDLIWLVLVARKLYQQALGFIMTPSPNWLAAGLFYLLFIAGIVFFVVNPAVAKESIKYALFAGMFFGLITYATYDLTNLATLKDWPVKITIIDLIWGSCLSGIVSFLTTLITLKIR